MSTWQKMYKLKGWDKYAKFEKKGGFNRPYLLFKAKNMIDKEIREKKWDSARPIAPGTKHPMKRLLSLVGRALYFMVMEWKGEHFITKPSIPTI